MVGTPTNCLNITQQGTMYFDGISIFTGIDGVAVGDVLTSNGTGVAPTFQPPAGSEFHYTNVNHAASPYTVLAADEYISVDCSGGSVSLLFPNAPTAFREWVVKDRTGNAATNNISITTVGGSVTFDGQTTISILSNYGSVNLLANATPTYEVY